MTDPKQFTDVIYEVRDRAAWIIINRPKVYNAFRGQTLEEMIQALHLAANDRQVASIVLTGAGDKASAREAINPRMRGNMTAAA